MLQNATPRLRKKIGLGPLNPKPSFDGKESRRGRRWARSYQTVEVCLVSYDVIIPSLCLVRDERYEKTQERFDGELIEGKSGLRIFSTKELPSS